MKVGVADPGRERGHLARAGETPALPAVDRFHSDYGGGMPAEVSLVKLLWLALVSVLVLIFSMLPLGAAARIVSDDGPPGIDAPALGDDWTEIARRVDNELVPIPRGPQLSLSSLRALGGRAWGSFREPLPSVPVWNPPGPKRVGLQAGHYLYDEAPDELSDLRRNPGTSGGGQAEWQVNLEIAERTAGFLRAAGVEADVLPVTIPIRYRANAFVAIHADGDNSGVLTGYKVGRPGFSSVPEADDALVAALNQAYRPATGLTRQDNQISLRMTYYYAFNSRRYQHAVAPGVPQAIIETGFLTNWSDRQTLLGDPDCSARGIADGVLAFLKLDLRESAG